MNSGRKGMVRSCSVTGHKRGDGEEEEAEQPQPASKGSRLGKNQSPSPAGPGPPRSQKSPSRPMGQAHMDPPSGSTRQVAETWHGEGSHGFRSSAHVGPAA